MWAENIIYMWDSQKWKVFHKDYEYKIYLGMSEPIISNYLIS